jgi:hypothetical protein
MSSSRAKGLTFSSGTKRPKREADHSFSISVAVKHVLANIFTPYVSMAQCIVGEKLYRVVGKRDGNWRGKAV